jgi:hypothetical protein
MAFGILTLLIALAIAGVAAWFSIVGLMAIFSASAWSIAIMAGTLEVGKLLVASWLYRYWDDTKWWMKTYLTAAVLVLMLITSMGIFGYLSKAHLDQAADGGNNTLKMQQIELRIEREQRKINDANTVIAQLDQSVQTLIDYDRIRGPDGSIAVRESQAEERASLNSTIDTATNKIAEYQDQLLPLQQAQMQVELKVGPLKYVAELIYGESSEDVLDKAVRLFILLLVFVFDPLAIIMVIAANQTLLRYGVNLEKAGPDDEYEHIPQPRPKDMPSLKKRLKENESDETKNTHTDESSIAKTNTATTVDKELSRLRKQNKSLKADLVAERSRPPEVVEKEVVIEDTTKASELLKKNTALQKKLEKLSNKIQELENKQPEVVEKIIEKEPEVIEKEASGDLRAAAKLMASSELNKEDLSEDEIYELLQKSSEDEVKRKIGFWAMPLPKKDDNDADTNKVYIGKK